MDPLLRTAKTHAASMARSASEIGRSSAAVGVALLALAACKRSDTPPAPTLAPAPSPDAAAATASEPERSVAVEPILRVGYDNACVIADEGVLCWGSNHTAKLGRGVGERCGKDSQCQRTPIIIEAFDEAVDVALGNSHTCLLDAEGGVSCLGSHANGQLGLGSTVATVCTVGGYASKKCALDLQTEKVTCAGTTTVPEVMLPCVQEPTPIPGLALAHEIRADGPTCVLTEAGAMWCAGGYPLEGLITLPARCGRYEDPCARSFVEVISGEVADADFGTNDGCVLMRGGRVRCGGDRLGQLNGITDARSLSVGHKHACVVRGDGTITCAGWNAHGQLGSGHKEEPTAPARLVGGLLTEAIEVAVGSDFSCGVRKEGELWCWGTGSAGQLGQGDAADHYEPVEVPGIPPVRQVGAGGDFVCIMGTDQSIWCWGSNDRGQLGIGADADTTCKTDRIFDPDIPCATSPVKLTFPTP